MDRRDFMFLMGSNLSLFLSGCIDGSNTGEVGDIGEDYDEITRDIREDENFGTHPWSGQTITMSLEQVSPAEHGVNDAIIEAAEYWNDNARRYAGFDVTFQYRPNLDEADVVIYTHSDISEVCGQPAQGCAPVITSRFRAAPEPAEIKITNERRSTPLPELVKHEMGHTLGLTHDDEPQEIMSDDYRHRLPNYQTRIRIYNNYHAGYNLYRDSMNQFERGTSYFDRGNYRNAYSQYSAAHENLRRAEGYVNTSGRLARSIDLTSVEDRCRSTSQAVRQIRYATQRYTEASQAYAEGNRNYGERLRKDGSRYQSDFNPQDITGLQWVYENTIFQ